MRKKILKLTFVVTSIAIATYNLYISKINYNNSNLRLANIELLAYAENTPKNPYCYNGGIGSSSCSIGGGLEILGFGVSTECSVSCVDGFYACCGIRCTCKETKK